MVQLDQNNRQVLMARTFVIVTDSTCDLPKDLREKYSIEYLAMNYVIDEKEYEASLDWEAHSSKEFYDLMRGGKFIKTTMVPADTYLRFFDKCQEEGKDILYVSCSSGLSGSYNVALSLATEYMSTHSDITIRCVDSRISSLGQGYLTILATQMRDEGKSIEEIATHIETIRQTVNQNGTVSSFEYLKRCGRVKFMKAFFGDLIGIKPILISDEAGMNVPVKKIKGARASLMEIAKLTAESAINPEEQTLFISHADAIDSANFVRDEALKIAKFKDVVISTIAPIVGASVGPGTVIAFAVGKPNNEISE